MAAEQICVSRSPEETQAIAEALAPALLPGDIVALSGDLGAGKTAFVQGAARGLGVKERVTSPTFVIVREYQGRVPVLHVDVYRLGNLRELVELGYEEFLDPAWVVFIEWGDAVDALLPDEWLEVELRREGDEERRVVFRAHGREWGRRLAGVRERTASWKAAV
ncbi:MAG: tRNA (adenosine(37)-N6)-threonylcarbamoyltransferase complex ATPase subunit type 1 TsaE [Acidobacteria bacterium]|nr:tRNA (adenosine(37)-N6)-threonylcarbamoyltransferase complex ATPase subunit type 1 TsaE [Acidobacteriota bacterium]